MPSTTDPRLRRHLRFLTAGMAVMAIIITLMGGWLFWRLPPSGQIIATRLHIVDDAGRPLITLAVNRAGQGDVRVTSPDGARLLALGATEDGNGFLVVRDSGDADRVQISGRGYGDAGGAIVVLNGAGRVAAAIFPDARGDGQVQVCVDRVPLALCKSVPVGRPG